MTGSTPGPSRTVSPSTRFSRWRAVRVAAMASASNSRPSRSSSAREASMLARIAPAGLVVAVASTPASRRAGSIRSVRASTRAAWLQAGSVLCALVTIASAPTCSGCGGRSGWKPKCAAHAASTISGTWCACATSGQAPHIPDGADVGRIADEHCPCFGVAGEGMHARSAGPRRGEARSRRPSPGGPTPVSVPRVRVRRDSERCSVRLTMTVSPSPPMASARAWLACVAPPVEKRQTSAPHRLCGTPLGIR